VFDDAHPDDLIHDAEEAYDLALEIELAAPPPLAGGGRDEADGRVLTVSRTQRKKELRRANTDRVVILTHLTGLDPQVVNGQLNRDVGLRTIDDATVRDLERRLQFADRWLDQA
jgi:hypothetical protein